jgi:hypothetical protein
MEEEDINRDMYEVASNCMDESKLQKPTIINMFETAIIGWDLQVELDIVHLNMT